MDIDLSSRISEAEREYGLGLDKYLLACNVIVVDDDGEMKFSEEDFVPQTREARHLQIEMYEKGIRLQALYELDKKSYEQKFISLIAANDENRKLIHRNINDFVHCVESYLVLMKICVGMEREYLKLKACQITPTDENK